MRLRLIIHGRKPSVSGSIYASPRQIAVSASGTTCTNLVLLITPTKAVGIEVSPTDHPIIITAEH